MGRPLRFIPPGAMIEVTTRTVQGRLLLRPSVELNEVVLGVIGRAQHLFGVEIHAFCALSNHIHMLLTVRDAAQLASFMAHVNGNIAREVGRLHDWRERFWGRRFRAIVVADETAQVARLHYILAQGVKEGLVARPRDWPGASCVRTLLDDESLLGTWFDRTAEQKARRRRRVVDPRQFATTYPVRLAPLPCWRHLDPDEIRRRVADLVCGIEAAAVAERSGRSPLGAQNVCAENPHRQPPRTASNPAPCVHATTRAIVQVFRQAYRNFVDAFRTAAQDLWAGAGARTMFPAYAFPPPPRFTLPPDGGADPFWAALSTAAPTAAQAPPVQL